jgi:hypothetical protein
MTKDALALTKMNFVLPKGDLRRLVDTATPHLYIGRERKYLIARKLWEDGRSIETTLMASDYLKSLGITPSPSLHDVLRIHPSVLHEPTRVYYPALIAAVTNLGGEFKGIHRVFLHEKNGELMHAEEPRMLGHCFGSFVHLQENVTDKLIITAGLETGLAMQESCPDIPVWVAMTRGNMRSALPSSVKEVIFCIDGATRHSSIARKIIEDAIRAHEEQGQTIRTVCLPANWFGRSIFDAN